MKLTGKKLIMIKLIAKEKKLGLGILFKKHNFGKTTETWKWHLRLEHIRIY